MLRKQLVQHFFGRKNLVKPSAFKLPHAFERRSFSSIPTLPYMGLFAYISKNKQVHHGMAQVTHHKEQLACFKEALLKGDFQNPIFAFKHNYSFLLYLLSRKEITFLQGMSLYVYLLAREQFQQQDNGYEIEMLPLIDQQQLTPTGKIYFSKLTDRFNNSHYPLDINQLMDSLCALPVTEQYAMKIRYEPIAGYGSAFDNIVRLLINHPSLLVVQQLAGKFYCYFPSMSVMDLLHKTLFTSPLQPLFMFGTINKSTLLRLHAQDSHPIALFNNDVKKNYRSVHGLKCGPFGNFLHDLGHLTWGSMFNAEDRQLMFTHIVPQLTLLVLVAKYFNNGHLGNQLQQTADYAGDFDLVQIENFSDANDLFTKYLENMLVLRRCFFGKEIDETEQMIFLLMQVFINASPDRLKTFWRQLLGLIQEDKAIANISTDIFVVLAGKARDISGTEFEKQMLGKGELTEEIFLNLRGMIEDRLGVAAPRR